MNIIEIAQLIASGGITINQINCEFCKSIKIFTNKKNGYLLYCEELEKLNFAKRKEVVCRHLFKSGRGCPFVLSRKTCYHK